VLDEQNVVNEWIMETPMSTKEKEFIMNDLKKENSHKHYMEILTIMKTNAVNLRKEKYDITIGRASKWVIHL